jgi:uncharacterized protein (TIGR03085 family)
MSSIAATERTHLCALAQQLGPSAPTLCEGWDVKDLVIHLLVREGSPAAVGIVVPPLAGLVDRASARLAHHDFDDLVKRLRHGPPPWSVFALPKVGAAMNLLEYFVHHEDIRRAQPGWEPRSLPPKVEDGIWRAVRHAGKGLAVRSPVGVTAQRSDTDERVVFKPGRDVVLHGLPSEIALYAYGRKDQSRVELRGNPEDVAAFTDTSLGL